MKRDASPLKIDLALQGGGAHGAFTWGVLDRLLDEKRLTIEAVSGASAGAMNAVVMAHGLVSGGRSDARQALEEFWRRIADSAARTPLGVAAEFLHLDEHIKPTAFGWWSPAIGMQITQAIFSGLFSPYQFNPFNLNPLLDIIRDSVDFDALRRTRDIKLMISTTRVSDGGLRIFRNHELSADVVMASACLPELFHAVEIEGESYWDGGYVANPAFEPLIAETEADDLLLIQLNPPRRDATPKSAKEIANRLNEIMFNANLRQALHLIGQLKIALNDEAMSGELNNALFRRLQQLRIHRIAADETVFHLHRATKMDPRWEHLLRLRNLGATAAEKWLESDGESLGVKSSIDFATL